MERQVRGRAGRVLPALVLLVALALGALAGGPGGLPSPALQTASTTQPTPPTNVRAIAGSGSLTIAWDPVSETGQTGYKVYFAGTLKATVTGTATTTTVTGLTNGQLYSGITVRTTTTQILIPYEGVDSAPTSGTPHNGLPPAAPSGFTATGADRQVALSWSAPTDLEVRSYELRRDGVLIASPTTPTTTYTDTGRVNGTAHAYTLTAVDVAGMKSASSTATATPRDAVAPAAPTGLTATAGDRQVALSWTANGEYDIATYRVLRDGVQIATTSATASTDTGLVNGVAHSYQLQAVDTSGNVSSPSAPAVSATPDDGQPPAAPAGFTATGSDRQVALLWSAATDLEVRSYELRRDGVLIATPSSSATSYTDTGRVNGTTHTYTLVAVDVAGQRSTASTASATPRDAVVPAAPTGLTATPGDRQVALSWTASGEPDIASYRVLRDGVQVTVATGTSYTDTGRTNGVAHSYRLVAVDTSGNASAQSAAVSATPRDAVAPAAPAGLTATAGDRQVALSWTANGEYDVASYRVFRDGTQVAVVTGTSWTDTGRSNGVGSAYTLRAVDTSDNVSAASAAVTATPHDGAPSATPTGFVATAGDRSVVLSWDATTDPEVRSYEVRRGGALVATPAAGATTWTDTGLTNGTAYAYTLVAVDVSAMRSAAAGASATPTDTVAPDDPTGLMAMEGDRRIALSWTPNAEDDVAAYLVYRDGTQVATVTGISWVDTDVTNGAEHEYRIAAGDTSGNLSARSALAVLATAHDGLPPAAPADVTATPSDRQVALSWTASVDPEVRGYELRRDGVLVAGLPPAATGWTDTGLVNGVRHDYELVAVDVAADVSSPPATASATPRDAVAPGSATGLSAAPDDGRVTLSWTPVADYDVAYYGILRDGTPVGMVSGSTFTDTGLTNGTAYSYTVVTVDTSGNDSAPAGPVVATPRDAVAPAAPTGLVGTPGDRQVALTWDAGPEPDIAGYRVWRDGAQVAVVTGTSWTDAGLLVNGTAYVYAIQAIDTSGNDSAPSDSVPVTPADTDPPSAPTGLTAVPGDELVALTWNAVADADGTGYAVLQDGVEVAAVTGTGWTATGLANGREHSFTVVAVDGSGNRSQPSVPATATPRDAVPPAAPTGLAAVPGDGEIALTWDAAPEADVDSYRVVRDGLVVAVVSTPGWTDTGLVNGTPRTYAVIAVDTSDNDSDPSAAVPATPRDAAAPAPPEWLAAVGGDGQVELSWHPSPEADVVAYRVLRDGAVIEVRSGTTYVDTDVVNGTTYTYTLVAVDTSGNDSDPSDPAEATPADPVPAPPTGLAADAGDGTVTLTWDANGEADLDGYVLLRDGVEIAAPTGETYVDTDVVNGTTYTYALVAVDRAGGRSPESDPVPATPQAAGPAAPTGLVADAGDGRVTLSWDPNAEPDLDGYVLLRDGVEIAAPTGETYVDTDVVNGTTYTYALVAVDTQGRRSPESDPVEATPVDAPPAAPTGVTAGAGDARVVVRWTAAPEADVTTHRVLAEDGTVLVEVQVPATSATVTGLTNGTTYRFRVVAVDAAGGESDPSDEVEATPVAATVAVPVDGVGQAGGVAVSTDGDHLVVGTRSRLDPSDTNSAYELYVVDRAAGTKRRIAPLPASATGTADPTNTSTPAVSDDGRYVVLSTTAKLLPADTNTLLDVYRFDTVAWKWELVSVPASGAVSRTVAGTLLQAGASVYAKSPAVAVSADGTVVLFYSARADLLPGDTNAKVDVFAKNMTTKAVTRVSTTATGATMTRVPTGPALALTPDGRFALFPAVSGSGPAVLYRKTLTGAGAGALVAASTVTVGGKVVEFGVFRDTGEIALSDDGRYVAFSTAAKLGTTTPTANWSAGLAYRKDLDTGAVVALGSGQRTVWEHAVELDPTGRYAFYSTSAPALAGDTNGHTDFFRRDLDGGTAGPLLLVTGDADGRFTTGPTGAVAVSEYGRLVALTGDDVLVTTSQALAPVDVNKQRDLYAKDLDAGQVRTPLA